MNRFVRRFGLILVLSPALAAGAPLQSQGIDPAAARGVFAEVRAICEADGGKLWGVSLCGPVLLVEPNTREAAANQSDKEGQLRGSEGLFVGKLPADVNLGNTALTWSGVNWTMLLWPLPAEALERRLLVAHELFHRVQEGLGLPSPFVLASHLDQREGRIWLRLELRALRQALLQKGAERQRAVRDALVFRRERHRLFPEGAANERALELNEGLAEYTGEKLRGTAEQETIEHLASRLVAAEKQRSYVRQAAYQTGAAYGFLLDGTGAKWRKKLRAGDDLGRLLAEALALRLPEVPTAEAGRRAEAYDGAALRAAEAEREAAEKKRLDEYRTRLVDAPVLLLPLAGRVGMSFDPYSVFALDESRTAYATLRVTAEWGILEATRGALVVREAGKIARLAVSAPADPAARPLAGDGWKLELAAGWNIVAGERKGDFTVKRSEQ